MKAEVMLRFLKSAGVMSVCVMSASIKTVMTLAVALAAVLSGPALAASNIELLLEEAVYLEETAGDLSAASEVYLKVLEAGQGQRADLARAHDRLATCYQKMGRLAEARHQWQELVQRYPEQKELVARARRELSSKPALTPVPWVDGEVLTYIVKLPTGLPVGVYVFAIESAADAEGDLWQIMTRRYHDGAANDQGFSRVTARQETMQPVQSAFRHTTMGTFETRYEDSQYRLTTYRPGGETDEKVVRHDQPVFDNDQWIYLTRRLPLELGYRTTLPLNIFTGEPMPVDFEVVKQKQCKVPAGTYDCLKAKSSIGQDFYYSTGPERLVVKMELSGASVELASVTHRRFSDITTLSDDEAGYSLTLPEGWFAQANGALTKGDRGVLHLLDQFAEQRSFFMWQEGRSKGEQDLEKLARRTINADSRALVGQKIVDDSWREGTVGGHEALYVTTEFRDGEARLSRYLVWVASDEKVGRFIFNVPSERLEALQPTLDEVVASLRLN
ncbi:MAG: hypothetical protein AAF560_11790 [Acidobacteriota bacterium]